MRLGTELIRKKFIDQAQLKEALDAQLIFGGHLGTCLIELGYIDEKTLGQALAETFGIPYASPEVFQDIPRSVTAAIPASLAEKHRAVPFKREEKILSIAMVDPKNLVAIDEIGFVTGLRIQPWIAPEARLLQALERYYDISRPLRYVTLCRRLDNGSDDTIPVGECVERGTGASEARCEPDRPKHGPAAAAVGPRVTPGGGASVMDPDNAKGGDARLSSSATWSMPNLDEEDPLQEFSAQMCQIDTYEALANAALNQFSRGLKRSVLFMVKHGRARPWKARGVDLSVAEISSLSLPVTSEPVFGLLDGDDHYRGPLTDAPLCAPFFQALKMAPPMEILLMPVHMNNRLVAICYGDGAKGRILGKTGDYRRFAQKLGLGMNLVLVKRRIQSI